jgi:hypothetical protein
MGKKLTCNPHTRLKQTETNRLYKMLISLLDTRSRLTLNNKILIYNSIIKPLWTYGLVWGLTKPTNLQKIQSLQSRIICKIANAPYYVSNTTLTQHTNPTLLQNPRRRLRRCWSRKHIVQWIKDIKGVFPMGNFSTKYTNQCSYTHFTCVVVKKSNIYKKINKKKKS